MRSRLATRPGLRMVHIGLVVASLVIGVAGFAAPADAQGRARVKIDFGFVAGGKDMPAGSYDLELQEGGRLSIRSADGKVTGLMQVITRLGRHDTDTETELVFDKVKGESYLSELWLPHSDGYLLLTTPADHEHLVIGASKTRK